MVDWIVVLIVAVCFLVAVVSHIFRNRQHPSGLAAGFYTPMISFNQKIVGAFNKFDPCTHFYYNATELFEFYWNFVFFEFVHFFIDPNKILTILLY